VLIDGYAGAISPPQLLIPHPPVFPAARCSAFAVALADASHHLRRHKKILGIDGRTVLHRGRNSGGREHDAHSPPAPVFDLIQFRGRSVRN